MSKKRTRDEVIAAILAKTVRNDLTGCVVWHGRKNHKGYGLIRFQGKNRSIHRLIYETFFGGIPKETHVLHRCDNAACVNVEHFFTGTNRDNIEDKISKDRSGKKLNIAKVREIKQMLAIGVSQSEIARRFGIHQSGISKIRSGQRWAHVTIVGG